MVSLRECGSVEKARVNAGSGGEGEGRGVQGEGDGVRGPG